MVSLIQTRALRGYAADVAEVVAVAGYLISSQGYLAIILSDNFLSESYCTATTNCSNHGHTGSEQVGFELLVTVTFGR